MHNLEYLDVDPESVEAVVITQGHPDNCRALDGFLGMRETPVKVYAPAGLYDGKKGFFSFSTGLSEDNRAKADLDVTDGWFEPIPGVTVTPFPQAPAARKNAAFDQSPSTVISPGERRLPTTVYPSAVAVTRTPKRASTSIVRAR